MVHEVQDCLEVTDVYVFKVEERVRVGVALKDFLEEWGAGRYDKLVCLELSILTDQGDVKEASIIPKVTQPPTDVALEGIATKKEFFTTHSELHQVFFS